MTVLNPQALWLLVLALLPWLGWLRRPRRARSLPWAATRFLEGASPRAALRLRLWRSARAVVASAALACLVLAAARPLGRSGSAWPWRSAPELVLVCLDRSPAMEALGPDGTASSREAALATIQRQAMALADTTRFLIVDGPRGTTLPVAPQNLSEHPAAAALDVPADLPGMLALALDRIAAEAPVSAEVWIVSGALQAAWRPDQPAWTDLRRRLAASAGRIAVRWFRVPEAPGPNRALRLEAWGRAEPSGEPWVRLAVSGPAAGALAVTVASGDRRQEVVLAPWPGRLALQEVRLASRGSGPVQGLVELPADANPADNRAFFAIPARHPRRILVACGDPGTASLAAAAAAPDPQDPLREATVTDAALLDAGMLAGTSLVVLDEPPPAPSARQALAAFVQAGGAVLVLAAAGEAEWLEVSRGALEVLPAPLAGQLPAAPSAWCQGLPLEQVWTQALQPLRGGTALATLADGRPMLVAAAAGTGVVVWCAVPVARAISNLEDGRVLVPLVQRLLARGAERTEGGSRRDCGSLPPGLDVRAVLSAAEDAGDLAAGLRAGLVLCRAPGAARETVMVLERPRLCDDRTPIDSRTVRELLGTGLREDAGIASPPPRDLSGALLAVALLLIAADLRLAAGGRPRP